MHEYQHPLMCYWIYKKKRMGLDEALMPKESFRYISFSSPSLEKGDREIFDQCARKGLRKIISCPSWMYYTFTQAASTVLPHIIPPPSDIGYQINVASKI